MAHGGDFAAVVSGGVLVADSSTMNLIPHDSPLLRTICEPVTDIKAQVRPHFKQMIKLMRTPRDGVRGAGLAAPQVGILLRFFVFVPHGVPMVIVNPSLSMVSSEWETREEGCLSKPGFHADIARHLWITAAWTDERGQGYSRKIEGWSARVFQHEIDHLNGVNIFK